MCLGINQSNQLVPKKESLVVHHLYYYLIGLSYSTLPKAQVQVHPYRYIRTYRYPPTHQEFRYHHIVKKSDKSENKKRKGIRSWLLVLVLTHFPRCIRRIVYVYVYT